MSTWLKILLGILFLYFGIATSYSLWFTFTISILWLISFIPNFLIVLVFIGAFGLINWTINLMKKSLST